MQNIIAEQSNFLKRKMWIVGLFVCLIDMLQKVRAMVLNATFNNISVILWVSVSLVEEIAVPEKKTLTCRKSLTNFIT